MTDPVTIIHTVDADPTDAMEWTVRPYTLDSTPDSSIPILMPDECGIDDTDHCDHCGARPEHRAISEWGAFCLACCRWLIYTGPPQAWGDGMGQPL